MRGRRQAGGLGLGLVICAALMGAGVPESAAGQVIRRIEVQGTRGIEEETIRSFIGSRVGEELSREQVSQDIQAIFSSGFVTDVRVELEEVEGGAKLTYVIAEKPLVQEVVFEGNTQIKTDELEKLVDLRPHSIFDAGKVRAAKARIEEEYEKKGLFLTEVTPEVEAVDGGRVRVIFHLREYKKPQVKRIKIFGAEKIPERKLKRAMQGVKESKGFTRKPYNREEMFRALYFLDYYYKDHGFLDLKVAPPERLLSPDLRSVHLGVGVDEGIQYRVGTITVSGDLLDPEEVLKKNFALKEGEIFRQSQLQMDLRYLTDRYGEEGYALVDIDYQLERHPAEAIVHLKYMITKGKKVYFERIEVTGNDKTHDKVIRRELTISETQLYSSSELRRSQARVQRLGYFHSVDFIPRPGSADDRVNVDIVVKERPAGALSAGGGYSTTENFFFTAQYSQQNFLGRGQSVAVQTQISERTQNYYFRFDDRYFLDSAWRFGFNLFSTEQRLLEFTTARRGGNITVGRQIPHTEYVRAALTYSLVQSNLESYAKSSTIYRRQPSHPLIGSLTVQLERNALDNYLDPTKGSLLSAGVEVAGYNVFGGEHDFIKTILEAQYYQPLPKTRGTYLCGRVLLGLLDYQGDENLLITERFFLGGIHTLRGYEFGAVGPVFVEDSGVKTPIGGNKEIVFNVDYVIPISKEMGLKWVVFYDIGNAFNDDEPIDFSDLRQDWGVGLRWISPMGPLRFEMGFPIDRREGERSEVFNFAIGTNF